MRPRVVGFGESLLRLSAPSYGRLDRIEHLDVHIGGAELNTLIGVAALGGRSSWITALADNPLGRRIANHAAAYGVDSLIDWDPDARAPLYFVEHGVPPRPSEVLYDRGDSAMQRLKPDQFDWKALLTDANAAFTTGITCALGEGPQQAALTFLQAARDAKCETAFDLNYRSRMWGWHEAVDCLRRVLPTVSVLFASSHDLHELLGADDADPLDLARIVCAEYTPDVVVVRETRPEPGVGVSATVAAVTVDRVARSDAYQAHAVDAFGAGDAAVAAFLTDWLRNRDLKAACDLAAWACAFQHTIPGDAWQLRDNDLATRTTATRRILR